MVEPRFRSFLVTMISWIDDMSPSMADIRDHLQDTLTSELAHPKKRIPEITDSSFKDSRQPERPHKRPRETSLKYGPIQLSYGPLGMPPEGAYVYDVTRIACKSTRPLAVHNGKHPGMLEVTAHHPDLYNTLLRPFAVDLAAHRGSEKTFHAYIACDHGRHRSVACAWLLHYLMKDDDIPHDFLETWDHSSHPHDAAPCSECTAEISSRVRTDLQHRWKSAKHSRH